MRMIHRLRVGLLPALILMGGGAHPDATGFRADSWVAPEPTPAPDRRIALTFDDLPMTGATCDLARVREVTRKLTRLLAVRSIPSAGLATPGRDCLHAGILIETLGRWQAAGAIIGNHTAAHPDINSTPLDDYFESLRRGQALIDGAVRTSGRWFRPPYLHTGDNPRKKKALASYLQTNGYRMLPVTVDNQEWVYAAVYDGARRSGDDALARRVVVAYVEHLEASMAFYERLSAAVFGREIPQVLLLHANLLNADELSRVLDMLTGRGYRFVGVPEALSDPAYSRPDPYVGPRGLSWLQRWALAEGVDVPDEPREATWVAEVFQAMQRGDLASSPRP